MLGDLKISVENRIKELEETQNIYRIEIYSDWTGWNKHLEIYYKRKPHMCIPICIVKKKLTPRYIKALAYYVIGSDGKLNRHRFFIPRE